MPTLLSGLTRTAFEAQVVSVLFPDNEAVKRSVDISAIVPKGGNTSVTIPSSYGRRTVVKNRFKNGGSIPGNVQSKKDKAITAYLQDYSTDPELILEYEKNFLQYNKAQEVILMHTESLREKLHNDIYHSWVAARTFEGGSETLTSDQIVVTTGSTNGATVAKKMVTANDILNAWEWMENKLYPKMGRILLIHPTMYKDILKISDFISAEKYGQSALPTGVIGTIHGFYVYVRAGLPSYDVSSTPALAGADEAFVAGNSQSAIFYHESAVARGIGDFKYFHNPDVAQYYGDVESAAITGLGARLRNDGVFVLTQANV